MVGRLDRRSLPPGDAAAGAELLAGCPATTARDARSRGPRPRAGRLAVVRERRRDHRRHRRVRTGRLRDRGLARGAIRELPCAVLAAPRIVGDALLVGTWKDPGGTRIVPLDSNDLAERWSVTVFGPDGPASIGSSAPVGGRIFLFGSGVAMLDYERRPDWLKK